MYLSRWATFCDLMKTSSPPSTQTQRRCPANKTSQVSQRNWCDPCVGVWRSDKMQCWPPVVWLIYRWDLMTGDPIFQPDFDRLSLRFLKIIATELGYQYSSLKSQILGHFYRFCQFLFGFFTFVPRNFMVTSFWATRYSTKKWSVKKCILSFPLSLKDLKEVCVYHPLIKFGEGRFYQIRELSQ